jgi:hypothetical protein
LKSRNRSFDPGRQWPLIALGVSGYAFHAAQSIFPSLLRASLRSSRRTPQTADRQAFQEVANLRNVGFNASLTALNLAKYQAQSRQTTTDTDRKADVFSMASHKRAAFNDHLLERFIL